MKYNTLEFLFYFYQSNIHIDKNYNIVCIYCIYRSITYPNIRICDVGTIIYSTKITSKCPRMIFGLCLHILLSLLLIIAAQTCALKYWKSLVVNLNGHYTRFSCSWNVRVSCVRRSSVPRLNCDRISTHFSGESVVHFDLDVRQFDVRMDAVVAQHLAHHQLHWYHCVFYACKT